MRDTPSFWYRPGDSPAPVIEKLLAPASFLYGLAGEARKRMAAPARSSLPVICIGNLNAGGTGKTPTALAVRDLLIRGGVAKKPFFLTRGYGGLLQGPLLVDAQRHDFSDVGDEALLLSQAGPTVMAAHRPKGALLAEQAGADMIIMDDGLQNPSLHKDLRLLVVNGEMGFGNGKLLPAGPLRASLSSLGEADAFIMIGPDERDVIKLLPPEKPVFKAALSPRNSHPADKNVLYFAFAGLGYPEKFFGFLKKDMGFDVAGTARFADHHPYSVAEIAALREKAKRLGATLLTTDKDYMRIPAQERAEIRTLPVELKWQDESTLLDFLQRKLALKKAAP